MKKSACVILTKKDNDGNTLILGVSRKDNHSDFGLIGGKTDDTDPSTEFTAIRETKEETGLDICNLNLIDIREYDGYECYCYLAEYRGRINHNEPHVVEWVTPQTLINGSFGEYNRDRFKTLGLI
jgi:8-oxo-dGTP pyrophosphatase MutT (NUDIX family)